jgi:phage tail-like protein
VSVRACQSITPELDDPALTCRFCVTVDVDENGRTDLGSFSECDGLSATYQMRSYAEGGQNAFVHQFAGPLKYDNVKLSRPIDANSATVAAWFSRMREAVERTTATITALDTAGQELATWTLVEVYPVRWSGPSLSATGSAVAKETLELTHNGFSTEIPAATPSARVRLAG